MGLCVLCKSCVYIQSFSHYYYHLMILGDFNLKMIYNSSIFVAFISYSSHSNIRTSVNLFYDGPVDNSPCPPPWAGLPIAPETEVSSPLKTRVQLSGLRPHMSHMFLLSFRIRVNSGLDNLSQGLSFIIDVTYF